MTELFFNGEPVNEEELHEALDASQEYMKNGEARIEAHYGVSPNTASAIFYLRTRSRWTQEKEQELIDRDHAGNPISLGAVISGTF